MATPHSAVDETAVAPSVADRRDVRSGVIAAVATYGLWGVLPLFFRLLDGVDPMGVVASRVIFSLVLVGGIILWRRQIGEVVGALRNRRALLMLGVSAGLIGLNWLVFVWAVGQERVLEVSFGYFINPLVSVAIGFVFLSERLTRLQYGAIGIAIVAMGIQASALGGIPWVALFLAMSFAVYGYVRKTVAVSSIPGLMIETLLLAPLSLLYLVYLLTGPAPGFFSDPSTVFWLVLTGPVTAVPLMLFAFSTRQLRLSTVGMFQYIAPSLQFAVAVLVFGEDLSPIRLASFALIWISLVVFTFGSLRARPPAPV